MKTRSRIGASLATGRTRLDCIRSCAPIHLRETPDGVYLVGGAAGPLGGDDLLLEIEVEAGATLVVRSAAASLALPGSGGGPSTVTVDARVAAGGTLHWLPEPVIAGGGCDHRIFNRLALAPGANVVWRDELVLGRREEATGRVESRIDATIAGRPLLRNLLTVGPGSPGWDGPAVIGTAGAAGSLLVAGPRSPTGAFPAAALGSSASILPLAGRGALALALAQDSLELRALLDRALDLMTQPGR
ncbi:MAG: urease accessory protein UreD [Actinomycetota bacterium]